MAGWHWAETGTNCGGHQKPLEGIVNLSRRGMLVVSVARQLGSGKWRLLRRENTAPYQGRRGCRQMPNQTGANHAKTVLELSLTIPHIQESLCRAHIQALAGMAGVIYEPTSSFDYGVDGRF
jgi:hypothetical protein